MLELCLLSGMGEGVMQALPGAEQGVLEEKRSVSAALSLTAGSQADKKELESVQMSRARQAPGLCRWGNVPVTCFWRSLKGQPGLILKSASGEVAELCVLEGNASLFAWMSAGPPLAA